MLPECLDAIAGFQFISDFILNLSLLIAFLTGFFMAVIFYADTGWSYKIIMRVLRFSLLRLKAKKDEAA